MLLNSLWVQRLQGIHKDCFYVNWKRLLILLMSVDFGDPTNRLSCGIESQAFHGYRSISIYVMLLSTASLWVDSFILLSQALSYSIQSISYLSLCKSPRRITWKPHGRYFIIWREIQVKVYYWEAIQTYKGMFIVILIGGRVLLLDVLWLVLLFPVEGSPILWKTKK